MKPIRYSLKDGITHFHYKYSDLKQWIDRGNNHGDAGPLLMEREDTTLTYVSYGTIENPVKHRQRISIIHHELMDGKLPTDQEIITPSARRVMTHESHRLIIFDLK